VCFYRLGSGKQDQQIKFYVIFQEIGQEEAAETVGPRRCADHRHQTSGRKKRVNDALNFIPSISTWFSFVYWFLNNFVLFFLVKLNWKLQK
jgi:hypothetical protein